ncbi:phosphodiester glycosidase family protein [Streptomyces sp. H27-G5]|uniref:phosphodiester glycosidase family protein n=1 Tax=Streptomyces sp. H27-G5 TaxID=2996698 RepID=UPI00226DC697|nr:phosphodiester glycosidase family protein [Streptomyces sp. H27-G5]MCY0918742.1 phosphodiester glycosidase family protein [Streptomyces sp. H27-G5]
MSILRPPPVALLAPLLCGALLAGPPAALAAEVDDGIETARTSRPVAPGVRLESYDRLESDRWLRVDELVVDLAAPGGVRAEYLGGRGAETVAEAVAHHPAGPGRRVVGAVNGDFFDIRGTGAPLGPGVRGGRLLHSASPGPGGGAAVGFAADGSGRVLRLGLTGSITLPGGAVRTPAGYNAARPLAEGFAVYTADWPGSVLPDTGPTVELRDGRVAVAVAVPVLRRPARRARPAPGTTLLAAAGAAAPELGALRVGDPVSVTAAPLPEAGPAPLAAVGGREPLVVAGIPQNHDGEPNNTAAPRTAVGLSRDGRSLRLVTADGRMRASGGLTLTGLGRMMRRLGSHEALNLDGGGSSTLLAALSGATGPILENTPSDGKPRPVPNGLALTAPMGSGRLTGYRVEAADGATRLFPGLTRTLTATGHDSALGPAPGTPSWSAEGAGRIGSEGVLRGSRPGPVTVRARTDRPGGRPAESGRAEGSLALEVLGPLTRIRPTRDRIGLADRTESAGFDLTGYDAQGRATTVEPRDTALRYDRSRWRVAPDGRGGFTVRTLVARATGRLRLTVPATGATAELALGAGLDALPLADLEDAGRWKGTGAAAAPGEGHPGTGIALTLPAAAPTATAAAARPIPLPEQARSVSLWVRGDGSGARPAVHLTDGDGTGLTLRGPAADRSGWRRITLPLPATAERPLRLTGLSATEGGGGGPARLLLDTLTAETPPTGAAPRVTLPPDPVVSTPAGVRARPWRFAVSPDGRAPGAGADFVLAGVDGRPGFTHRGVRFVPLDGRRRTLDAGGGLDRMRVLAEALTAAAREPGTGAVAVVQRYAPGIVDRNEAALLTRRLAEFRRASGKRAALFMLDAPRFAAGRTEGVPTVTVGRAGRTLIGVDAFAAGEWLSILPGSATAP